MNENSSKEELPAFPRLFRLGLKVMLGLILVALLAQTLFYSLWMFHHVSRDWNNTMAESAKVERALAVAKGEPLMSGDTGWPHRGAGYGALFYYATGWTARLIGLEGERSEQAQSVFVVGRSISMLAALSILLWMWLMSREAGLDGAWRFLPLLFFFSALPILRYAYCYRADYPMTALALWAWFVVIRGKGIPSALGAAALMALAFYFKKPALAPLGVLWFWLFCNRDFRRSFVFLFFTFFMIWVIGFFLGLLPKPEAAALVEGVKEPSKGAWLTAPFAFLLHPTFDWGNSFRHIHDLIMSNAPGVSIIKSGTFLNLTPFLGGLVGSIWFLKTSRSAGIEEKGEDDEGGKKVSKTLLFAFALTFLGTQFTVLHYGSSLNYYVEAYCWGALLTAAVAREIVKRLLGGAWKAGFPHPAWLALLCAAFVLYGFRGERCREDLPVQLRRQPSAVRKIRPLLDILSRVKGEVLLTEGQLYFHTQSPPTFLGSPYNLAFIVKNGKYLEALLKKLENKDFELVVLDKSLEDSIQIAPGEDVFPLPVLEAIETYYRFDEKQGPFYLYRPLGGQGESALENGEGER